MEPTRLTTRALFVALLLLLSACIKVDQRLTLHADGSGVFAVNYGMREDSITQIEAMARQEGDSSPALPFQFDEKQVRKDFAVYARDGVELQSFTPSVTGGWKFVELGMTFRSLDGLMKTGFLSDRKLSLQRRPDGNYLLSQQPDSPHLPSANATNAAVQEMMASLMKGFHASMAVETPGPVLESNGSATGRVVSWVFDLEQDAQAISRAQQMEMRVVFAGRGLNLPSAVPSSGPVAKP